MPEKAMFSLQLDADQLNALRDDAKALGVPVAQLIRAALRQYLDRKKAEVPPAQNNAERPTPAGKTAGKKVTNGALL